jgi:hypothetical protein
MSRYNNSGGSSNGDNDNDYDDDRVFKLTKYCQIRGEIDRLNQFTGDYGQTGLLGYTDVEVLDGMLYQRVDDANKLKVFSWDSLYERDENGDLPDDVSVDAAPPRNSEKVAGSTYKYELIDAAIEGETEPVEVGDITMFLSNSSASRTLMKTLTTAGHNAIVDKDDEFGWMLSDLSLRPELDEREVIHFHVQESFTPDGESESVEYTAPVLLDGKTEERITIPNADDESAESAESGSLGDSSPSEVSSGGDVPSGVPEEADGLIDYFARTGEDDPENVEQMLESEVLDMAAVDMDAVMSEIQARV